MNSLTDVNSIFLLTRYYINEIKYVIKKKKYMIPTQIEVNKNYFFAHFKCDFCFAENSIFIIVEISNNKNLKYLRK